MAFNLFQYHDYKRLVRDSLERMPNWGRGQRKKLAEAIGCQTSFLTHVLSGQKDFNHEQGIKVAKFLMLSETETEFFLTLISFNRAGSKELADYQSKKLAKLRLENENLKARLKGSENIKIEDQALYYSHWLFSVVHMASTIPALQDVQILAEKLKTEKSRILQVVDKLRDMGLVSMEKGRLKIGRQHLYLDHRSPFIAHHHTIWRNKMVDLISNDDPQNLHFSMAFSISEKDFKKLREFLVQSMDHSLNLIRPSPEEKLAVFCLDLQALT